MTIDIHPLGDVFGARVDNAGPARAMTAETFTALRTAFETYSVLVLSDFALDDEVQVAFSERFGPVERVISANPARGTAFARQSNIDMATGDIIAPTDRRMEYQKGNMRWHADSTFKSIPSLCSILSAREVPPVGGETQFASTRAAYEALSCAEQAEIQDVLVEHSVVFSRRQAGFEFTAEEAAELPAARHPLVQLNALTGRKSVLIGAHASHIVGWPQARSRALLDRLHALATQPANCFSHQWRENDAVIWDNRAALHRATPYNARKYRRLMQRTTVSNLPPASA